MINTVRNVTGVTIFGDIAHRKSILRGIAFLDR